MSIGPVRQQFGPFSRSMCLSGIQAVAGKSAGEIPKRETLKMILLNERQLSHDVHSRNPICAFPPFSNENLDTVPDTFRNLDPVISQKIAGTIHFCPKTRAISLDKLHAYARRGGEAGGIGAMRIIIRSYRHGITRRSGRRGIPGVLRAKR